MKSDVSAQIQNQIQILKEHILSMGTSVEKALASALEHLSNESVQEDRVRTHESRINHLHKEIDGLAFSILGTSGVSQKDLRLVFAIVRMNTDLERMGDQAVNIAQGAKSWLSTRPKGVQLGAVSDLPRMARDVTMMVKDALEAFTRESVTMAQNVLILDDLIDNLKRQITTELIEWMKRDSSAIESALSLIMIARSLERLGDHATNVAEDVVFIHTGEDIRHSSHAQVGAIAGIA